jgi:hypothetical protein
MIKASSLKDTQTEISPDENNLDILCCPVK